MPVTELILSRFPATAEMAVAGILVALLIAVPLGILAAKYPNSWTDRATTIFAVSGAAIPHFWLGPLFILLFSITTGWFPVSGRGTLGHLVLPALTLGTALAAILMRMLRSSLLEELRADYIRTARAKGASERRILFGHAIRNALLPVVTLLALQFGSLLTGAVITETIFSWPGLGRLLIQAIFSRDYPLVQGCVLVFAILYLLVNLVADLLYGVLDPRIQS
jgi:peptide/nickel transport system permease protein